MKTSKEKKVIVSIAISEEQKTYLDSLQINISKFVRNLIDTEIQTHENKNLVEKIKDEIVVQSEKQLDTVVLEDAKLNQTRDMFDSRPADIPDDVHEEFEETRFEFLTPEQAEKWKKEQYELAIKGDREFGFTEEEIEFNAIERIPQDERTDEQDKWLYDKILERRRIKEEEEKENDTIDADELLEQEEKEESFW